MLYHSEEQMSIVCELSCSHI